MKKNRFNLRLLVLSVCASLLLPISSAYAENESAPVSLPSPDLWGYADLHVHQFGDLSFGGLLLWGKTYTEDGGMESALPPCDSVRPYDVGADVNGPFDSSLVLVNGRILVHGPDGLTDVIGGALTDTIGEPQSIEGWPDFDGWPTWKSVTHQQVYYEWLKRAWEGGLRLIIMHAVNDKILCFMSPHRTDYGCEDMPSVDRQIQAAKDFENWVDRQDDGLLNGSGWYRIVTSAHEAREVISQGKLAAVLGIEVNDLFGCLDKSRDDDPNNDCTEESIRTDLDRYKNLGVRNIFPVHIPDNYFGSGALYMPLFNYENRILGGHYFSAYDCSAEGYNFQLGVEGGNWTQWVDGVIPFITPVIEWVDSSIDAFLTGLMPGLWSPGILTALGIVEGITAEELYLTYSPPAYSQPGQCNAQGLQPLGVTLINEMMQRGLMIEVDHMSKRTTDGYWVKDPITGQNLAYSPGVLDLAEQNHYAGVIMGHTGFVDTRTGDNQRREREKTAEQLDRLRHLGGMLGVGLGTGMKEETLPYHCYADENCSDPFLYKDYVTSNVTNDCSKSTKAWAQSYLYAVAHMKDGGVAFGSDFNGFGEFPAPRYGPDACDGDGVNQGTPWTYGANGEGFSLDLDFLQGTPLYDKKIPKDIAGNRAFDFNQDGMTHIGMYPDMINDLRHVGVTDHDLKPLFRSAEAYVCMWENVEDHTTEDPDNDSRIGHCDNCPADYNPFQEDADNDGVGDVCDNCPNTYNPDQADNDKDGFGNACPTPDLVITGITLDPAQPETGQPLTVKIGVKNQGDGAAGPFSLDFFQDYNYTLGLPGSDYPSISCQWNSGLAAGVEDWATCEITVAYSAGGNYSIYGYVDGADSVSEKKEDNNASNPWNDPYYISICDKAVYYLDSDGDGYGNPDISAYMCPQVGYVANNRDSDDNDASINPVATELCDGKDNDSDGRTDEVSLSTEMVTQTEGANGSTFPRAIVVDSHKKVHVLYIEGQKLWYATTNNSGQWIKELLDDYGVEYVAMKIDGNDNVHVSYGYLGDVKYARREAGSGTWTPPEDRLVIEGPNSLDFGSLSVDSGGKVHISYYDPLGADLKYATNKSGTWVVSTVDSAGDVGMYNDLDVGLADTIYISYYDKTNGDLKYTKGTPGAWTISTVASTGDVGQYTSIGLGANCGSPDPDAFCISYFDATNGNLMYYLKDQSMSVESGDEVEGGVGLYSLIADGNIGYYSSEGLLRFARPTESGWDLNTVVGLQGPPLQPLSNQPMAIDADGNAHFVYFEESKSYNKYGLPITITTLIHATQKVSDTYYRDADGDGYGTSANSLQACAAPAGYVANNGDCNDADVDIKPGAQEACDGKDNDCDAGTPDGSDDALYNAACDGPDSDLCNEGVYICKYIPRLPPKAGGIYIMWCNDATGNNVDVCDGADNDCNADTPDGSGESWFWTACDGTDTDLCNEGVNLCANGVKQCSDNSGNTQEVCDGIDNDCDGQIDEGLSATFYRDADGDGYGDAGSTVQACAAPSGYVANNTDCLDSNADAHPGGVESCDGVDNDCDGVIDDGFSLYTFYRDADDDGYGNPEDTVLACAAPLGYVSDASYPDCDDGNNEIYPAAIEKCDNIDNDCDGAVDNDIFATEDVGYATATNAIAVDSNNDVHIIFKSGNSLNYVEKIAESWSDTYTFGTQNATTAYIAPAIAVDSANNVHVVYLYANWTNLQAATFSVRYAYKAASGSSWTTQTIKSQTITSIPSSLTAAGISSAMVVDSGGHVHLSYYNPISADLIYATNGTGSWATSAVETTNDVGMFSDIAIDSSGTVYISYYDKTFGDLKYAFGVPGAWSIVTAASTGDAGKFTSIRLRANCVSNPATGVEISYYDATNGDLMYYSDYWANTLIGVPPHLTCKSFNGSYALDSDGDTGNYASMSGNNIGYYDATNQVLKFVNMRYVLGIYLPDFNTVDNGGSICSLALGPSNRVHISYRGNDGLLKHAEYTADFDGDGFTTCEGDCNDDEAAINPDANEVCDGIDNNCDGQVDEGVQGTYYEDADGDGYGNPANPIQACAPPYGYVSDHTDCDDALADVHPGASEICNEMDDNCNGFVDEGVKNIYFRDSDGDSYGDPAQSMQACSMPDGYVTDNTDCQDFDAAIMPGAPEVCDGIDNDCNADTPDGSAEALFNAPCDGEDSDLCDEGEYVCGKSAQGGFTLHCSDVTAGNPEICDGIDNDCNPSTPDGSGETWIGAACDGIDADLCNEGEFACVNGQQECSDNSGDSVEVCDGVDNDCDGSIDEGVQHTYYGDADEDGYGNPAATVEACSPPEGFVENGSDCDDSNANVKPGAAELCDGVDNDCSAATADGSAESWYESACDGADTDLCNEGVNLCVNGVKECSDKSSNTQEVCDGMDNDCDGQIDEGVKVTFYADADGDGSGNPGVTIEACDQPETYVKYGADCNDGNAGIHPGVIEICDGVDNDCDGLIDEAPAFFSCMDGDLCNGVESCVDGHCEAGIPWACDDGNGCTDDSCDAVLGCQFVYNTEPCDDGNPGTCGDICSEGVCAGTPGCMNKAVFMPWINLLLLDD